VAKPATLGTRTETPAAKPDPHITGQRNRPQPDPATPPSLTGTVEKTEAAQVATPAQAPGAAETTENGAEKATEAVKGTGAAKAPNPAAIVGEATEAVKPVAKDAPPAIAGKATETTESSQSTAAGEKADPATTEATEPAESDQGGKRKPDGSLSRLAAYKAEVAELLGGDSAARRRRKNITASGLPAPDPATQEPPIKLTRPPRKGVPRSKD
jgi:hypothetical protein